MTTSSYMLHTRKARIFLLAPQIFQSLVLDRYLVDVVLDVIHLPQGLCHIDGTCACDDGLRGRDCTIVCNGGRKNPCTGHGDQGLAS